MKNLGVIFILLILALVSCKDEELVDPSADYVFYVVRNGEKVYSPDEISVGEVVVFQSTGAGDYFSVFTGDENSNYALQTPDDSIRLDTINRVGLKGAGWPLTKIGSEYKLSYKYKAQGEYNIVFVASSSANFGADRKSVENAENSVKVFDRETSLEVTNISGNSGFRVEDVAYSGDSVLLWTDYNTDDFVMTVKFSTKNATVTRNDLPVERTKLEYRDKKVDFSNAVTYKITAADGETVRNVTFVVVFRDRRPSTKSDITNITVGVADFSIDTVSGSFLLTYPHGGISEAVTFDGLDKYIVLEIGDEVYSGTDELAVKDLLDNTVIVVTPEDGDPKEFKYSIVEEKLSVLDFSFVYPEAIGLAYDTEVDGDTTNVKIYARENLWNNVGEYNVIPNFGSYKFTTIKSGSDVNKLTEMENAVDTIVLKDPVLFEFVNGDQTEYYRFSVEKK